MKRLQTAIVAALLTLSAGSALAAKPEAYEPGIETTRIISVRRGHEGEAVTLKPGLVQALIQGTGNATVDVPDWPVAPGQYRRVIFERREVYAPDAKILQPLAGGGYHELPKSELRIYNGTILGDDLPSVSLAVDPKTRQLFGFSIGPEGRYEMRPNRAADARPAEHVVAELSAFLTDDTEDAGWACGEDEITENETFPDKLALNATAGVTTSAISTLHTITVAVETDNEFMNLKFGNNTTTAADYLAKLFARMNIMYERDLLVRLVQGQVFLRTSDVTDPYPSTSADSTSTKLNEFTNYWGANMSSVTRGLTTMLSGKSSSANSAAGIAWVGQLCSKSLGYNFTQIFRFAPETSANDAKIVGHEIGHNFGAKHSDCDGLDQCPSGCYSGTSVCPPATTYNGVTNVRGTVMSYCHLMSGCSSSEVFHPTQVSYLNVNVQNAVNACVFPLNATAPAPMITSVSPASGLTTGGTPVTITGTNFRAGATVTFGGTSATGVVIVNGTTITTVAPAHAAGAVTVVVRNSDATSGSKTNAFTYNAPVTTLAGLNYYTVTPCRMFDTRDANGTTGGPAIGGNGQRTFTVTGRCGVPTTAKAILVNVTVPVPAGGGYMSAYAGNTGNPGTTFINFNAGRTRSNNGLLRLATNGAGTITIANGAASATDVILDVQGYLQ